LSTRTPRPRHTAYPEPDHRARERSAGGGSRLAWILILSGLALIALWLAVKTIRIADAANSLMRLQAEAEQLTAGGLMDVDPNAAEALVRRSREDVVTLRDELAFVRPLAPVLGRLPRVGPLLEAGPHLLDMADGVTEAADLAVGSLKPALSVVQRQDFGLAQMGELLPVITAAEPELEAAGTALERAAAARDALASTVPADQLPWRVQQLLALSDENLPLARQGLALLPSLPALLGQDGPRRYLIMAQNEDELRSTGGFLTGAGLVTVENGRITGLEFQDANVVDNYLEKPYDFPPQPLFDFMLLELHLFRDANYWPDFPTSARKAMDLYAYGQDVPPLDGVFAIDQEFLRLLVEVVGSVPVEGTNVSLNSGNLLEALRSARDPEEGEAVGEWVSDRKAFLAGFAVSIRNRFESDFGSIDPVYLIRQLQRAADTRHLQVYLNDPEAMAAFSAMGWDGRLPSAPPGDLWAVVDTNMGYNKVNIFIERAFDYEVDLSTPASPVGLLTVYYRHTGPARDEPCYQGTEEEFEAGADYLATADQCYWNYVRAYVPAGSELIESSRHTVPGDALFSGMSWDSTARTISEQPGLTTFDNFLLVPRAGQVDTFFRYRLPAGIVQSDPDGSLYQLTIHKQAGTRPEAVRLAIKVPPGAVVRSAVPQPSGVAANTLYYEFMLESNETITVRYR
jgi:hypothetical protein